MLLPQSPKAGSEPVKEIEVTWNDKTHFSSPLAQAANGRNRFNGRCSISSAQAAKAQTAASLCVTESFPHPSPGEGSLLA